MASSESSVASPVEPAPLVSVIVSTYNRPELLEKTLRSIQAQSLDSFECIVVDDCSERWQENHAIVQKIRKSNPKDHDRFQYMNLPANSGHDAKPKNIGILEARGQFVAFLDDDDQYRIDALKILSTYLVESEADVCYGDYLIGGKPGWSVDFSPMRLQHMNYIAMCVVMAKRSSLLKVGGFDEDVPKFKDWNLWLRLQKASAKFIHVPIIVAEVSEQAESISNKYKVKFDETGAYLPIIIKEDGTEHRLFDPVDCTIYPVKTSIGPAKPLRVAVYTLTMDRLELTQKMYASIRQLAGYPFDWFVIDNGSKDGTVEWLKMLPPEITHVEYNPENVGLANGWNQALNAIKKAGGYDIVVKVDNDAEMLTKGWLKAMVALFERNRTLVLSPYVEGLEKTPGGTMRQRVGEGMPYVIINETVLGNVPNIGGIVFAHELGLVDEWTFDPKYRKNKDYILCQYARALGYSVFYMEEYRVSHQLGTAGQHEKYPEYFAKPSNDSADKTA